MAPKFQIKVFQLSRFVKNFTIISVVTLSFLLVFFSKTDYYVIYGIKNISSSVVVPVTRFISAPINAFSKFVDEYNQFRSLKFENKILQEEIIRLKKWQTLAIQNSRENKVLKKLLNATDNNLTLVKTASLINRNDTIYSKLINLNAGYEDKIKKNMSAINERGLVGKVIDTTANNSRVILLTDPNLSISVKSISDEIFSLLTGNGDGKYLVSSFVKENKMPRLGDIVVTSGTAQIFPVDLLVGKVAKVEKNRFFVLPFVDFENIDYVQIVTSK
ncbi:MAG: rod shape-determining protein MreC [Candidatus Pelagibacterales bacterium]|nr:MAG: rod shape-determining protein MreC [Pelagibacterales bacterium]